MRHSILILLVAIGATRTLAQPSNPVYTDDSPAARDTIERLRELLASGNEPQAVRALQKLLDEEAGRTLADGADPSLYHSVRDAVHDRLRANPDLLARYRQIEGPIAQRLLEEGRDRLVEETLLLTPAGHDAALRVAQRYLEMARFEAARMTLEQLESHPDRLQHPGPASDLYTMVARYLDRPDVWERAKRWAADAGRPAPDAHGLAERPAQANVAWRWAFDPIDEESLPAAPRRPLWTSSLIPDQAVASPNDQRGARLPVTPDEVLWVLPSATADTIYTNDGIWITAWDRYTLEVKWRVRPPTGADPLLNDDISEQRMEPRNFGSRLEDPSTVTVAGSMVVATTGLAIGGSREGDPRVHAIDAETGELYWSVLLQRLDPRLDQAVPMGPVLVDADTVVVAARKSIPGRRIISVTVVGLDLYSGELRWILPLASAGALPYVRAAGHSDGATLDEGVFYRVDELGALAAVEAVSGRLEWIRTMTPLDLATRTSGSVYQTNIPIVHGDCLYVRSADRRSILKIDRRTGRQLAERSAGAFGSPRYLVGVGEYLAAVSPDRVSFVRFDDFERGTVSMSPTFPETGVNARAVSMADRLLAPTSRGIVVLDPADPSTPVETTLLDHDGNFLPMGSALIVVDDLSVHSYLDWSVAEALLIDRMEANPNDPMAAITYAELAFRAGHAEKVPDAAGRALAAIRAHPSDTESVLARERLFMALRQMVEVSQAAWDDAAIDDVVIRDLDVMEGVIARLSQAAEGPSQRAAALLVEGRLRDAMLEPGRAIEAYQSVLADPMLAQEAWISGARRASAGREAARRERGIVMRQGPGAYVPFEAEARRRLASIPEGSSGDVYESVAARYPVASVTSDLWRLAAGAYERAGNDEAELRCLHSSVLAARVAHESGTTVDPAPLARAVTAQVQALARRGRYSGAAHALYAFSSQHPEMDLSVGDPSVTTQGLLADLREQLARSTRPARIGADFGGHVQTFVGWQLMDPVIQRTVPSPGADHVMMLAPDRVALFADIGVNDDGEVGMLVEVWSRGVDDAAPELLRSDPDAIYLAWHHERGLRIECIDSITGHTRWISDPFQNLFEETAQFEQWISNPGSLIPTPRRTNVHVTDTLVASDAGTLLLIERTGRVAAFDERTGEVLWKAHSHVDRLMQADAAHGIVVLGGTTTKPSQPSALHALDVRTGREIALVTGLSGRPEWIRVVDQTHAIAETDKGLFAYDLATGQATWALQDGPGLTATAGWVFGDDLYLIDASRVLWHVSVLTGELTNEALTSEEQMVGSSRISLVRLDDHVGVLAPAGVLLLEGGKLVAADGLGVSGGLVPPEASEGRIIAMEATRRLDEQFNPMHVVHVLRGDSLRLERSNVIKGLWDNPRQIAVLESRLAVTAGPLTFIYDMPADAPRSEQ